MAKGSRQSALRGACAAGALLALAIAAPAAAAPGDPDPQYSPAGVPGAFSQAFRADGPLQFSPPPIGDSSFADVVALPDGSQIAVGTATAENCAADCSPNPDLYADIPRLLVAKLTPAGELDPAFSPGGAGAGYATFGFGHPEVRGFRVVGLSGGFLLVAGQLKNSSNVFKPFLARLTAAGDLDTSFPQAGGGVLELPVALNGAFIEGLAVGTDNKINLSMTGPNGEFLAARLSSDGVMDTGYSGDGIANPIVGNNGAAHAPGQTGRLALINDQTQLIPAGGGSSGSIVVKLVNGALDTTWASSGPQPGVAKIEPGFDHGVYAPALEIDSQGRALVVSASGDVARLTTAGVLDPAWSPSGAAGWAEANPAASGADLVVNDSDQTVIAGRGKAGSDLYFSGAFERFTPTGAPDTAFYPPDSFTLQPFGAAGDIEIAAVVEANTTQLYTVGAEVPDPASVAERALISRLGAPGTAPNAAFTINRDPNATASEIRPGETLTLDSSASSDDVAIVRREWSIDGGPFEEGPAIKTVTVPEPSDSDRHALPVKLQLTDGDGLTRIATQEVYYRRNISPELDVKVFQEGKEVTPHPTTGRYTVTNGKTITFDATGSSDPDGSIVQRLWSFDGTGNLSEQGSKPTFAFKGMNYREVQVKFVDDEGAAVSTVLKMEIAKKKCDAKVKKVTIGKLVANASCWADNVEGEGKNEKTVYENPAGANINGIEIAAKKGIKLIHPKGSDKVTIEAPQAEVTAKANGTSPTPVVLQTGGKLSWTVDTKTGAIPSLEGYAKPGAMLGGISIVSIAGADLTSDGHSKLELRPELPKEFGSRTPNEPPVVELGPGPTSRLAPFVFEVTDVPMDPIYINKLRIEYRGNGSWLFDGRGELQQPMPIGICGQVEIENGKFKRAHLEATFVGGSASCPNKKAGDEGLHVGMSIYITSIEGDLEFLDPGDSSNCVKTGKEFVDIHQIFRNLGIEPPEGTPKGVTIDYGTPTSAFCVQVFFAFGPSVLGQRLLKGDIKAGFAAYEEKSDVFFANGRADLLGNVLTKWKRPHELEAAIEIWTNGYMALSADLSVDFQGLAQVGGFLRFESFLPKGKFNAHGYTEACIADILCDGAEVVASHIGVGACRRGTGPDFGGYLQWAVDPGIVPYLVGCDLSDIKVYIDPGDAGPVITPVPRKAAEPRKDRRAAANEVEIDVDKDRETLIVGAEGLDALPKVSLVDPDGNVVLGYDGVYEMGVEYDPSGKAAIADSERFGVVNLIVEDPKPGKWIFRVDPGSVAVSGLQATSELPPAKLDAKVIERGGEHFLEYRREVRKGESIRFTESGPSISGEIGAADGAEGEIRFEPAPGAKEKREIVAWTTYEDGRPGQRIVVGTYNAPAAPQPPVNGLKVKRKGKKVVATWNKSPDADEYEVFFELKNGDVRHTVTKKTSGLVKPVPKSVTGKVTVTARVDGGLEGKPEVARFGKKKRKK